MADPELLVHLGDQLDYLVAPRLRHPQLERAGEMQRLDVAHPGERHLVLGPLAGDHQRDLVLAGARERPVVRRRHALDHIDRVDVRLVCKIGQCHAIPTLCRLRDAYASNAHATPRYGRPDAEPGYYDAGQLPPDTLTCQARIT